MQASVRFVGECSTLLRLVETTNEFESSVPAIGGARVTHPQRLAGRYGSGRRTHEVESPIRKHQAGTETAPARLGVDRTSPWRELGARLRNREHAALEELFNLAAGRAFGLAYRVLDDGPAAEDIVQDAFLWVWNNAEQIDPGRGSVESLLMTIVHRRSIDSLRRRARLDAFVATPREDAIDGRARDLADSVLESIDIEKVESLLQHLNPDQRTVIEHSYFRGLSHREIAERLSIPEGTVKSRMRLGLTALRRAFGLGDAPSGGAVDGDGVECEAVRDLVPAYVFGSATAEERLAVAEHLATCDRHGDQAPSMAVSMLLAHTAPEMEPPTGLKERVLEAARRERGVGAGVEVGSARRPIGQRFSGGYGVAAALAIALGAMVVWNILLQTSPDPERFVHYYRGNDGEYWMRIETVLGEAGAEVSMGGLARLTAGDRYHLWATRGDDVLLVGAFNTNPEGQWAGEFDFAFDGEDRLWITAQPEGSSDEPVGEAVLRTRF